MSVEGEIEVEAAIEEADCAIIVADHYLPSSARAAFDFDGGRILFLRRRRRRYFVQFPGVFLLEEFEFPPLVHFFSFLSLSVSLSLRLSLRELEFLLEMIRECYGVIS